ncbi:MAG: VWA domain-containing protein [Tepidisphaeraceae bacterium]
MAEPVLSSPSEDAPAPRQRPATPLSGRPQLTFWQQPRVQAIVPLATSALFHVILIVIGIALFSAVQKLTAPDTVEQTFVPTTDLGDSPNPGGVPHPGDAGDPTRDAAQNVDRTIKDSDDLSNTKKKDLSSLTGSASADAASATTVLGQGRTTGGATGGLNGGIGEAGGGMAKYGTPGGGAGGNTKGLFNGTPRGARRVVYVCDASGSMTGQRKALLVRELNRAVQSLKPPQMFGIVFFRDETPTVFQSTLAMATPASKTKADEFITHKYDARGQTKPVPALDAAAKLEPQLIYLLTDGAFDDPEAVIRRASEMVAQRKGELSINTVLFVSGSEANSVETKTASDTLSKIANIGTGSFKLVREEDLLDTK